MMRITGQVAAVLAALRDEQLYGRAIMRHTGLPSGTVYPILARMEAAGWITGSPERNPPRGRPPRRGYRLTGTAPDLPACRARPA